MTYAEMVAITDVAANLAIAANNAYDEEALNAGSRGARSQLRGLHEAVWAEVFRLRALTEAVGVFRP